MEDEPAEKPEEQAKPESPASASAEDNPVEKPVAPPSQASGAKVAESGELGHTTEKNSSSDSSEPAKTEDKPAETIQKRTKPIIKHAKPAETPER